MGPRLVVGWITGLLVGASLAGLPAAAAAADTVIGFEGTTTGTEIKDQFQASGIRFARAADGATSAVPRSAPRTGGSGQALTLFSSSCNEFCTPGTHTLSARLDFARQTVTVTVTDDSISGPPGDFTDPPELRAHRLGGGADIVHSLPRGTPTPYTLTVTSPGQDIAFVEVNGVSQIDDVTYDNPASPPPPDFSLVPQFGGFQSADSVEVVAGQKTTVRLLLNRFNLSSGAIKFTAAGLPSGVTISPALPAAFNGPDGSTLDVVLNASANAASGSGTVTVTGTPQAAGAGATARSTAFKVDVIRDYDLDVTGVEVTQGIQPFTVQCLFAGQCLGVASLPAAANKVNEYNGLPLVKGKSTVARVFVRSATNGVDVNGLTVEVHAFDADGNELAGSPLLAPYGPDRVTAFDPDPFVTLDQRATDGVSFDFALPDAWTRKSRLRLLARIEPPLAFTGPAECATCGANNSYELRNIPFGSTYEIELSPVGLYDAGDGSALSQLPLTRDEYAFSEQIIPLADDALIYGGYEGVIDVGDLRAAYPTAPPGSSQETIDAFRKAFRTPAIRAQDSNMADRVEEWADDHPACARRNCGDLVMGIASNSFEVFGLSRDKLTEGDEPRSVVAADSVQKSVSHELIHGLGQPHAGLECGGASNGQVGSFWLPDNRGRIQGIGYDTKTRTPFSDLAVTGVDSGFDEFYDTMSYCASEGNSWTSNIGWAQVYDNLRAIHNNDRRAAAPRGAPQQILHVRAFVAPDNTVTIGTVKRDDGTPTPADTQASYRLVGRDAAGAVVGDVPMELGVSHTHDDSSPSFVLNGALTPNGVDMVEIVRDGTVVASRTRSANAPVVAVVSPKKGDRVGAGKTVSVQWTATDADNDALTTKLFYSVDGGKTFRSIFLGGAAQSAELPSELFGGSRKARVEVRVNDGFNETSARSAIFRAVGRRPSVRILAPGPGLVIANDASLQLKALALDDLFDRITARKKLTWRDGERVIGRGARVSVTGLRPGRRIISIVARDRQGRAGGASVVVRVRAVEPRFTTLDVPAKLGPGATSVTLRVASSLRGTLRVGAQRFAVGRKAKTVKIRVKPGSGPLALTLRLTAFGKTAKVPVMIAR